MPLYGLGCAETLFFTMFFGRDFGRAVVRGPGVWSCGFLRIGLRRASRDSSFVLQNAMKSIRHFAKVANVSRFRASGVRKHCVLQCFRCFEVARFRRLPETAPSAKLKTQFLAKLKTCEVSSQGCSSFDTPCRCPGHRGGFTVLRTFRRGACGSRGFGFSDARCRRTRASDVSMQGLLIVVGLLVGTSTRSGCSNSN